MKHLTKTLALASLLVVCGTALTAQTKQETKLYNTSVSKGDLKNLNKFLIKYPTSTYTPEITRKRDSLLFNALNPANVQDYETFIRQYPRSEYAKAAQEVIGKLNTSQLTPEEAFKITAQKLNLPTALRSGKASSNNSTASGQEPSPSFYAHGFKKSNAEHILALLPPAEKNATGYRIVVLKHNGSGSLSDAAAWSILQEKTESIYTQGELPLFRFAQGFEQVILDGEKYLHFNYSNEHPQNKSTEFIANLYALSDGALYSAMFSGKKEQQGTESFLEGTCLDASQGGALSTPQMNYLIKYLGKNKFLRPASPEKVLTDTAIEWWYSQNKANGGTLSFGAIPADHPIAQKFTQTKEKERGQQWDVAFFDTRETTVVVAYDKTRKQYFLVWCEPAPKNTKTDKFLNTIYFEKEPALALFYYKGNTTSKVRINLASKSIR